MRLSLALAAALLLFAGAAAADVPGRQRVSCFFFAGRTLVLVPFGQSNAANHGEVAYVPRGNVVNFNADDGLCYRAVDPLLGASAFAPPHVGSIWGRLGDLLLATRRWDRIVIAPIAQQSTFVAEWAPGGDMNPRIKQVYDGLRSRGLTPNAFLWIQGEIDVQLRPDPAAYKASFTSMVQGMRAAGIATPIYVAQATLCNNNGVGLDLENLPDPQRIARWDGEMAISGAQRDLVNPAARILRGPDLDLVSPHQRWDGCHLNAVGLQEAAEFWRFVLTQSLP